MTEHIAPLRLSAQGIWKRFGGVVALGGASFELRPAEVHALLGGNGAGKSTLIKVLTGAHAADEGVVYWEGERTHIATRQHATDLGIRVVYQHSTLAEHLTVEENIVLGEERTRAGFIDRSDTRERAVAALSRLNVDIAPGTMVSSLSVGQRKLVEIVKALMSEARVLVLDEPTASLGTGDSETLFAAVRRLREMGTSVIFITHHLDEILEISDRVTVMRDGTTVGTVDTHTVGKNELVAMMVGDSLPGRVESLQEPTSAVRLEVRELSSASGIDDVSFEIREGEILGVYGLIGAGRTELARTLMGVDRRTGGMVRIDGDVTRIRSAAQAAAAGIRLVPEDREREGVMKVLSVRENLTLPAAARISRGGWISSAADRKLAQETREKLRIKTASIEQKVAELSGGNQQKTVIGRWFITDSRVLILDDPTVGVDVGARYEIHRLIAELAASGASVLLASSDLDELYALSHRIMVLRNKRIAGFLPADPARRRECFDLAWGA